MPDDTCARAQALLRKQLRVPIESHFGIDAVNVHSYEQFEAGHRALVAALDKLTPDVRRQLTLTLLRSVRGPSTKRRGASIVVARKLVNDTAQRLLRSWHAHAATCYVYNRYVSKTKLKTLAGASMGEVLIWARAMRKEFAPLIDDEGQLCASDLLMCLSQVGLEMPHASSKTILVDIVTSATSDNDAAGKNGEPASHVTPGRLALLDQLHFIAQTMQDASDRRLLSYKAFRSLWALFVVRKCVLANQQLRRIPTLDEFRAFRCSPQHFAALRGALLRLALHARVQAHAWRADPGLPVSPALERLWQARVQFLVQGMDCYYHVVCAEPNGLFQALAQPLAAGRASACVEQSDANDAQQAQHNDKQPRSEQQQNMVTADRTPACVDEQESKDCAQAQKDDEQQRNEQHQQQQQQQRKQQQSTERVHKSARVYTAAAAGDSVMIGFSSF